MTRMRLARKVLRDTIAWRWHSWRHLLAWIIFGSDSTPLSHLSKISRLVRARILPLKHVRFPTIFWILRSYVAFQPSLEISAYHMWGWVTTVVSALTYLAFSETIGCVNSKLSCYLNTGPIVFFLCIFSMNTGSETLKLDTVRWTNITRITGLSDLASHSQYSWRKFNPCSCNIFTNNTITQSLIFWIHTYIRDIDIDSYELCI